ncbi:MAG: hypothetical protein H7Y37_11240 [Anaerolineae bacterium]|nr:hypothetical protein [Gloeobacterales cyanobacterium ES-bin-313]
MSVRMFMCWLLLAGLAIAPSRIEAQTVPVSPLQLSAEQLACIDRKVQGSEEFRAKAEPNAQGEYLIDLGAGEAQEGNWWRARKCRPDEQGLRGGNKLAPNLAPSAPSLLFALFDNSSSRTFFQTGYCKSSPLRADAFLTVDQAVIACARALPQPLASKAKP